MGEWQIREKFYRVTFHLPTYDGGSREYEVWAESRERAVAVARRRALRDQVRLVAPNVVVELLDTR